MVSGPGGNASVDSAFSWREHFQHAEAPFAFSVWRNGSAGSREAPLFDTRGTRLIFKVRGCMGSAAIRLSIESMP